MRDHKQDMLQKLDEIKNLEARHEDRIKDLRIEIEKEQLALEEIKQNKSQIEENLRLCSAQVHFPSICRLSLFKLRL